MSNAACQTCAPQCGNPFDRVVISYLIRGGTRVYWELKLNFVDPGPYVFQLQVGQSDNADADDWQNVGGTLTNIFYAVDGEQRIFGKTRWQFYRVKLITSLGTYYSDPTGLWGTLPHRWWRVAREQLRQEIVAMKKGPGGQLGYLLKRRVSGEICPVCTDPLTLECRNAACTTCFGTGFFCGYFFPISCVWASMSPRTAHYNQDGKRGTIADMTVKAHMANVWMMTEEDIWVNKVTDDRYYIHSIQNTNEFKGVPVSADVEMRVIPASDPAYLITIPNQLETVDTMAMEIH